MIYTSSEVALKSEVRPVDGTWKIVYLSSKETCPKILINKNEIKVP